MKAYFLCLILAASFCFTSAAQEEMTAEKWQEDILHLQQTVHQDFSFLFRKVTAEVFDQEVEKLIQETPKLEDHEVVVGIARLVALFGYGHTSLWLNSWRSDHKPGFSRLPVNFYQFSDGMYVQGAHKDYEKAVGAKVTRVGKLSVEEAMAAVKPVFSAENDMFYLAYGISYLGVPEVLHAQGVIDDWKKGVTFELEKDGESFSMTIEPMKMDGFPGDYGMIKTKGDWLDARAQDQTPLWLSHLDKIYFYEYLPDQNAVYVRQSQIQNDPEIDIPTFYKEVFDFIEEKKVDRLVLDVRLNGGGNNHNNKPVIVGLIKSRVNTPGGLYVITGRRTFSACQNLVNELEKYTDVVFVGEPTGENVNFYGDTRRETLPNSELSIALSFAWWQNKDPWDNRPWTAPQLAVDMSFEDYQSNKDPVLAAIWGHEYKAPPMVRLRALFEEGKFEQLQQEAMAYLQDPAYRYHDFEQEFNQAGYQLLNSGQMEAAVMVFGFNTQLFPESANVWDSLAEATWKSGDKEQAMGLYQKVIQMDPEGPIGDNARNMLKAMEEEAAGKH